MQYQNNYTHAGSRNFLKGIFMLLLASLSLSLQNVVVRIVFSQQTLLGNFQIGGFITPGIGNSLLILSIRVLFVVLGMTFVIKPFLYPLLWQDIRNLLKLSNRKLLWQTLFSGFLLFLSQITMYVALGNIAAGIATTIFFIYPTVTTLLAWLIFGNRPVMVLGLAIVTIYAGCLLVIPETQSVVQGNIILGSVSATMAGIAFAAYAISTQICSQRHNLHPVSFTGVTFITILILNTLSLGMINWIPELAKNFPTLQIEVASNMWAYVWGSAFILSITSIIGFLSTNCGIATIGATYASIATAS